MIVEPEQRVADFIKAGADIVSVHCEQSSTIHLHRTVEQVSKSIILYNSQDKTEQHNAPLLLMSISCFVSLLKNKGPMLLQIKSLGAKAGVVLNPGTPLSTIEYVLDGDFFFLLSLIIPCFFLKSETFCIYI